MEASSACYGDLYRFDTLKLEWAAIGDSDVTGSPPSARYGHGFASAQGRLYVFGGNCGPLEEATGESLEVNHDALRICADAIFCAGYIGDFYMFDVSRMQWSSLIHRIQGTAPAVRVFHGFTALENRVYIFGGFSPYVGMNAM